MLEFLAGAAAVLAAWQLGFLAGARSSKSRLTAAESVMKAANALSSVTVRVADLKAATTGFAQDGRRLRREMIRLRRLTETLLEMVKAELMTEVMKGRQGRGEARPLERVTLPTIPHGGASPWGSSTHSDDGISDAPPSDPRERERPT